MKRPPRSLASTRRASSTPQKPRIRFGRVVVLGMAAGLSVVGAWQARAVWLRLPGVKMSRLSAESYQRALRDANAQMSPEARQGLIAANISSLFTAALRDPNVSLANRETLQQMVGQLTHTQLGRLQLAAFRMLTLEQAGTPPAEWWPAVEPYLVDLDRAAFPHFLPDLIKNRTHMFESLGFDPGSAFAEAESVVAHPHGPFLQLFVERLVRVAAAPDESADFCHRLVCRLLQQWTLDPGPVGLRLLAADLLADELQRGDRLPPPDNANVLARDLRAWRAAYRDAAGKRPTAISLVSLRAGPEPVPGAYYGLLGALSLLVWAAVAMASAALVTILVLPFCLRTALWQQRSWRQVLSILCTVVLALVAWVVWVAMKPGAFVEDLQRWAPAGAGWPYEPFGALVITVALLSLSALPGPASGRRDRPARIAVVAAWAWLAFAATLSVTGIASNILAQDHELFQEDLARVGADYTHIAGGQADGLLDGLRAWQP